MELFKNTNFDFLGKKWPFIIASLVLTVAGLLSIAMQGGLKYGIDFKGGALMTVKFAGPPPLDKIRSAMTHSSKIKGEVSVQNFTGATAQNEVEIGTELQNETQLNINRQAMEDVLFQTFGQPATGKLDFNNASQEALADRLRDPLARAGVPMSEQQLQQLVHSLLAARDSDHSGLITDFNQLSSVPGVNAGIMNTLQQESYLAPFHVMQVQMVGPKVGAELRNKAILATLYALGGMLVYIAFRFEWIYGLGAVIAVFPRHDHHDRAVLPLQQRDLDDRDCRPPDAGGLLDERHHRDLRPYSREFEDVCAASRWKQVMNRAVNQTLSRTVMTSGLTFLTVIALFVVWRSGVARLLVCVGLWNYCRNVFFGVRRQSDRAVLA